MEYKVYCLLKSEEMEKKDKVVRVKVFADCLSEALKKAKDSFSKKLARPFNIFMYETSGVR